MRRVELRILAYKTKSYTDSTSKILYHMHAFKHVYVHLRVEGIEPSSVGLEPTMLTITPWESNRTTFWAWTRHSTVELQCMCLYRRDVSRFQKEESNLLVSAILKK